MKKTFRNFLTLVTLLGGTCVGVMAQEPLDGAYVKTTTKEKEAIPYDYVREADVFWARRIWRTIDVREKMNLPFAYPQQTLAEIINTAAKNGELTVYDNLVKDADQFKKVLPVDDVKKIGEYMDTVETFDADGNPGPPTVIPHHLEYKQVVQYRVKEDWFFDEKNSTMIVRIIGIAPMIEVYSKADPTSGKEAQYIGVQPMYWVYYPDLRPILAKYEVFNPNNDAVRLSWEDMFEARIFASTIYKESNVYDRDVQTYAQGIDALLESDKIKNKIFVFEHDLWNY
jgi:gliding motility associated protien GldN